MVYGRWRRQVVILLLMDFDSIDRAVRCPMKVQQQEPPMAERRSCYGRLVAIASAHSSQIIGGRLRGGASGIAAG